MVAAVAMFAAASCTQELENNAPETVGETVVFTASVDGAETKAVLDETTKRSEWAEGDEITLHNGTKSYDFTATAAGPCVDFSYTGNDFSGSKFMAVYPAGTYTADPAAKTVKANIPTWQQAQKGTYHSPAALAVAYAENTNTTLQFKNAHALLKFTVNTDNVTHVIFHGNNNEAITGDVNVTLGAEGVQVECLKTMIDAEEKYATWVECYAYHDDANKYFDKGQTYYIAVAPQVFNDGVTVKFKIDDGNEIVVKTTAEKVQTQAGRILNLGELEYKIGYWAVVGSMTNEWNSEEKMTLSGDWYVAEGIKMTTSDKFKFRADNTWGVQRGAEGDAETIVLESGAAPVSVGTKGKDIAVSADGIYSIYLSKAADQVKVIKTAELPTVSVPDQPSDWAVAGSFNDWADEAMVTTSVPDLFVAKSVTLAAYDKFKVKAKFVDEDNNGWGTSFGAGSINYVNKNVFFPVNMGSSTDISNVSAGTYDIYFDRVDKMIYLMTAGTAHTSAIEQTVSGDAPALVSGKTIYLNTGGSGLWNQGGAWFQAWIWGDGDQWVTFKETDEADIYSVEVPGGTTGLKILRRGPDHTAGSWEDGQKWNNTGDITLNSNNCITITGWGESDYTLSTK